MIRDRNIDEGTDQAKFAQETVILPINVGAGVAGVIQSAWRAPYAGKILAAHVYCATITDADDSARADLKINGVSALAATVDPVAADTLTSLAPTTVTFAAGDKLQAVITTGAGDAFIGNLVLVVRPLIGHEAL
jgi:sugar/nucleoside kinase (ribokinase family)